MYDLGRHACAGVMTGGGVRALSLQWCHCTAAFVGRQDVLTLVDAVYLVNHSGY